MNAPTNLPAVQERSSVVAGATPQALVPTSLAGVWKLSEIIANSGMAPKGMDTPEMISVAIMHGMEIGLTPMTALQSIAVVNGRPTIWGDGALGLIRASGLLEAIDEEVVGEGDKRTAICEVKRKGEKALSRSFSWADAKKANLSGKAGPWQNYPDRMMSMRARAFALRDGFADVLRGLSIREEQEDVERVASDNMPPPAPKIEPKQSTPTAPPKEPAPPIEEAQFTEEVPAAASGEPQEAVSGGVQPEDIYDAEAVLEEIKDQCITCQSPSDVDEVRALFAEDMESKFTRTQVEKAEHYFEEAEKRVAPPADEKPADEGSTAPEQEPALNLDVEPTNATEYAKHAEARIARTKTVEEAKALNKWWLQTSDLRTELQIPDEERHRLRADVFLYAKAIIENGASDQ